jgi:hypothetical protein
VSVEIEAIARAWMAHQGYTEEQVLAAEQQTHQNSGCDREGDGWNCTDENGASLHPASDALNEACEMANVAVAALESIGYLQPQRNLEPCVACRGRGTWETECCNGSSGCPCRGGLVEMGSCHACGGCGAVEQQSPMANANFILSNHIGYPGGGPR